MLEEKPDPATTRVHEPPTDAEGLATRLRSVERAYHELLEQVRRYERERAEIRNRLERLLSRFGT